MHYNYLDSLHNALNHHQTPSVKIQSPAIFDQFSSVKILAQSIISIERLHNDTGINFSNVSIFKWSG